MKKWFFLFVLAAFLAGFPNVLYAAEGTVTGQVKVGNAAPIVFSVTLVEGDTEAEASGMTPLSTYKVKATIGDVNTINDITEVEFHVFYTTDGSQWDADAVAIFRWTRNTGLWTVEKGTDTSWEIVLASSSAPSVMTQISGDWYLAFTPGDLVEGAQGWLATVTARDENKSGSGLVVVGTWLGAYVEASF